MLQVERTSACSDVNFDGLLTTSRKILKNNESNDSIKNAVRQAFGNKCAHNKFAPKVFSVPQNQKRPPTIARLILDFNSAYLQPKLFPGMSKRKDSARQMRSEMREMVSIGCAILTNYYDVLSGRVGFIDKKGNQVNISYQTLANKLSVSLDRVKRFFRFLVDKNWIVIKQNMIFDKVTGERRKDVTTKILQPSFFIETLGIKAWDKIKGLKKSLEKQFKVSDFKNAKKIMQPIKDLAGEFVKKTTNLVKKIPKPRYSNAANNPAQDPNNLKRAMENYKSDPSISLSEHLKLIVSRC